MRGLDLPCSGPEGLIELGYEIPNQSTRLGAKAGLSPGKSGPLWLRRWAGLERGSVRPTARSDLD